jgi:hypothetical protein
MILVSASPGGADISGKCHCRSYTMVVGPQRCAILLALLAAAAVIGSTDARPQESTGGTQEMPVIKLENCPHPRL